MKNIRHVSNENENPDFSVVPRWDILPFNKKDYPKENQETVTKSDLDNT